MFIEAYRDDTVSIINNIKSLAKSGVDNYSNTVRHWIENSDYTISEEKKEALKTVFCKPFLDKVAKYFWTKLHVQIGQSCKALASLEQTSQTSLADIMKFYSTRYGNGSSVSVSSCACSLK